MACASLFVQKVDKNLILEGLLVCCFFDSQGNLFCRGKLDIPEVTHNDEVVEEEESRDVVSALHVDADMLIF